MLTKTLTSKCETILQTLNRNLEKYPLNKFVIFFTTRYLQILVLIEPWLRQPSKQFIVCQQVISECHAYKSNLWSSSDSPVEGIDK